MNEVLVERRGDVVWLTFNRPEARNAMTEKLLSVAWKLREREEELAKARAKLSLPADGAATPPAS